VRHGEGLGAFYRPGEGEERSGCEGECWPSVGEFKSTVMARGGIGIERVALILGAEGLGDAWFPWRRRPEGVERRHLDGGDGTLGWRRTREEEDNSEWSSWATRPCWAG
jgi:hypothetical protein